MSTSKSLVALGRQFSRYGIFDSDPEVEDSWERAMWQSPGQAKRAAEQVEQQEPAKMPAKTGQVEQQEPAKMPAKTPTEEPHTRDGLLTAAQVWEIIEQNNKSLHNSLHGLPFS